MEGRKRDGRRMQGEEVDAAHLLNGSTFEEADLNSPSVYGDDMSRSSREEAGRGWLGITAQERGL